MAVSSNLGFVLGPALAGLLGATVLGEIVPVFAAFVISAVALALIQFGLVETTPTAISEPLEKPTACDLYGHEHKPAYDVTCRKADGFSAILTLPNMPALLAVNFLVMLGFSFFYVAFPVHAVEGLGWSVTQIGTYFALLSLAMIAVQGPILARASQRFEDRLLMSIGAAALAFGFALLYSGATVLVYASALLVAIGNGLMWPTFMAVLSKASGTRLQGAVQGFAQSAGAVASILGLVAGGVFYVSLGPILFPIAALVIAASGFLSATYRPGGPAPAEA